MKTSTTVLLATSLMFAAGLTQAQSQQQNQQPTQQQDSSQQQNKTSSPSQQMMPQLNAAPSSSQDSSGQSGGSASQGTSQGTSQSGAQQNDSSQSQSAAQSVSPGQPQSDIVQAQPQPQTENGITYLCGGIGEEQASFMKQSKGDYDLMLTFATRSGEYIADVDVGIKDAKGKSVLQTNCGGPILLVNLPRSGVYRVQAQAENYSLRKTVTVKAKGPARAVVMTWPRDPAENEGVASTGSSQEAGSSGSGDASTKSGSAVSKKHKKAKQSDQ
ncbi:MAG: hypothetical protein ACXU7H_00520 [Burkholderiaceae bacterium]